MEAPIWFIHGAHSTPRSFVWLKEKLPEHQAIDVQYETDVPVARTFAALIEMARAATEPFDIIGHSLGGLLGVRLAQECPMVRRVVTMGSPFGGSQVAQFLRFFRPNSLMDDIQPYSPFLVKLRNTPFIQPVMSLVTSGGRNAMIAGANDGIVSVASQMDIRGPRFVEVDLSHSEVLLADESVGLISAFLTE